MNWIGFIEIILFTIILIFEFINYILIHIYMNLQKLEL